MGGAQLSSKFFHFNCLFISLKRAGGGSKTCNFFINILSLS